MLSRAVALAARSAASSSRTAAASRFTPIVPISTVWARGMAKNRNRFPNQPQRRDSDPTQPQSQPASSPVQPAEGARPEIPSDASSSTSTSGEPIPTPPPSSESQTTPEPGNEPQKPFNLPDLTQGIPSTLEYETAGASNRSALAELSKEEEEEAAAGGRGKGELPASAYVSSSDRKRAKFANRMYALFGVLAFSSVAYLGRDWDELEAKRYPEVPNGWTPGLWWKRAVARTTDSLSYYQEPAFEKLLPDPDPMFERPYTLCISLEDMLVHSEWSRDHGWRIAKRPGVDYFLRYLSQYYELVLFTSVPFAMGEPLMRKLDPYRFIVWPLYREATKYKDGEIVKDLSYLNRDLSKVIIVDTNAKHVQNQPGNAIVLPKWTGDSNDKELVNLIPFLEYINVMQYKDVRDVLKSFDGKHIPTEFARREAIARAEFNKQVEAENKKKPKASLGGLLGGMLGLKPDKMSMMVLPEGEENPSEAFAKGKMLQDIARERGQRNYMAMEKEIRENGEKWLKEEQQMQEKAQQEAMQGMKSSLTSMFIPGSENKEEEKK